MVHVKKKKKKNQTNDPFKKNLVQWVCDITFIHTHRHTYFKKWKLQHCCKRSSKKMCWNFTRSSGGLGSSVNQETGARRRLGVDFCCWRGLHEPRGNLEANCSPFTTGSSHTPPCTAPYTLHTLNLPQTYTQTYSPYFFTQKTSFELPHMVPLLSKFLEKNQKCSSL